MAYKKYIKRGGKVYGPYLYHSKRVDGKVVSEYHGADTKKIDYKKFLWIGLGILVVAVLIFGVSFLGKGVTGHVALDIKTDYVKGEVLDGVLKLSLKQGELIPASSKLVFENEEEIYEYSLVDIISDKTVEGDFYVEGKDISGSGTGYGIEGTKEEYPIIYFTLEVYKDQDITAPSSTELEGKESEEFADEIIEEPEETEESVEEIIEEPEEPIGEIVEEPIQEVEDTTEEETTEEPEEPGITGGIISSFFGGIGTGRVVMELQTEINGQVLVDNPFTYTLNEGETVEVKAKSVRTDSEDLNDNVIDLEITDNEIIVTTDYSNLNLMLNEGDLKISLIYSEEELISLTTVLQEGETSEAQVEEIEIEEEVVEEVPEQEIVVIGSGINLTEEERAILMKEFGIDYKENIEIIRQVVENGRLKIGFQLGSYKIEYSYGYPQSTENLKIQIKTDKEKWLRSIASTLLRKASVPQSVDIVDESDLI